MEVSPASPGPPVPNLEDVIGKVKRNSIVSLNLSRMAVKKRDPQDPAQPVPRSKSDEPKDELTNQGFFGKTGFRQLALSLENNTSLTQIQMGYNALDSSAAVALSKMLASNKNLTQLALPGNKISVEGVKAISNALKHNLSVEILDLSTNPILNEGAMFLAAAVKTNRALTHVDLTSSSIYAQGVASLLASVSFNTSLTHLQLTKNMALTEGAQALGEMLPRNRTLRKLELNNNFLYADGAVLIAKGLALNTGLLELHLATNEIGDAGAKALADALKVNSTLTILVIHDNLIGPSGTKALCKSLQKNTTLAELHMCDNQIGVQGADHISDMLKVNKTLKRLHVAANEILAPGIKSLASGLKKNTTLTELNISWNRFAIDGARHIGSLIKWNTGLRDLQLGHNKIQDDGCCWVAEALRDNATLDSIDLSNNRIRGKGRDALLRCVPFNQRLCTLNLTGNTIPPTPLPDFSIEMALARNNKQKLTELKTAVVQAFHPRLGERSLLYHTFKRSPIGDLQVLTLVWDFLWSPSHQKQTVSVSTISSPPSPTQLNHHLNVLPPIVQPMHLQGGGNPNIQPIRVDSPPPQQRVVSAQVRSLPRLVHGPPLPNQPDNEQEGEVWQWSPAEAASNLISPLPPTHPSSSSGGHLSLPAIPTLSSPFSPLHGRSPAPYMSSAERFETKLPHLGREIKGNKLFQDDEDDGHGYGPENDSYGYEDHDHDHDGDGDATLGDQSYEASESRLPPPIRPEPGRPGAPVASTRRLVVSPAPPQRTISQSLLGDSTSHSPQTPSLSSMAAPDPEYDTPDHDHAAPNSAYMTPESEHATGDELNTSLGLSSTSAAAAYSQTPTQLHTPRDQRLSTASIATLSPLSPPPVFPDTLAPSPALVPLEPQDDAKTEVEEILHLPAAQSDAAAVNTSVWSGIPPVVPVSGQLAQRGSPHQSSPLYHAYPKLLSASSDSLSIAGFASFGSDDSSSSSFALQDTTKAFASLRVVSIARAQQPDEAPTAPATAREMTHGTDHTREASVTIVEPTEHSDSA